jgi:hypothetical protein
VSLLPALLNKNVLTATGSVDLGITLAGSPANLHMSSVALSGTLTAPSTPKTSADGKPPGHLTGEHVDPSLKSFNGIVGALCGNISAESLSQVPIPSVLLSGISKCHEPYTSSNHLLDVIVNGCTILLATSAINATDPDSVDPSQPPAGAGPNTTAGKPPYHLTSTGVTVTGCVDKNNTTLTGADLTTCLNAAAYSSYFTFTTDRVIMK